MDDRRQDWMLSLLLLVVALLLVRAMGPQHVAPVLRLSIARNADPISHLDQPRRIVESREVLLDTLDLSRGGRLRHALLGDIGPPERFFLALRKRFAVRQAGDYRFLVGSDDGFSLRIDNRPLCAEPRPRAYALQVCDIRLGEGPHEFALDYFQDGGQSGLSVQYALAGQARQYRFGENSAYFHFDTER